MFSKSRTPKCQSVCYLKCPLFSPFITFVVLKHMESRRLEIFFDIYKVEGKTIREKAENFFKFSNENGVQTAADLIINYID
jgi:hypothetical protein